MEEATARSLLAFASGDLGRDRAGGLERSARPGGLTGEGVFFFFIGSRELAWIVPSSWFGFVDGVWGLFGIGSIQVFIAATSVLFLDSFL